MVSDRIKRMKAERAARQKRVKAERDARLAVVRKAKEDRTDKIQSARAARIKRMGGDPGTRVTREGRQGPTTPTGSPGALGQRVNPFAGVSPQTQVRPSPYTPSFSTQAKPPSTSPYTPSFSTQAKPPSTYTSTAAAQHQGTLAAVPAPSPAAQPRVSFASQPSPAFASPPKSFMDREPPVVAPPSPASVTPSVEKSTFSRLASALKGRNASPRFKLSRKARGRTLRPRSKSRRHTKSRRRPKSKRPKKSSRSKSVRFATAANHIPSSAVLKRLVREKLGKTYKLLQVRRTIAKTKPSHTCRLHVLAEKRTKNGDLVGFRGSWDMDHHKVNLMPLKTTKVGSAKEWNVLHAKQRGWLTYKVL